MTSRVLGRGHGPAGALRYVAHDEPTAENPRPTTYDRVGHRLAFRGQMVAFDPDGDREHQLQLAARIIQNTITDAPHRKRAAGISTRGRRLQQTITHCALSWPEGETPSWKEMQAAGDAWIEAQQLQKNLVVMAGHLRKGEPSHLHIVNCNVSSEDGTAYRGNLALSGSRWAQKWEADHGGIVIQTRVERNRLRDELAAEDRTPAQRTAIRRALKRVPCERTRSNGPRTQLTVRDLGEWCGIFRQQKRKRRELQAQRPTTQTGRPEHSKQLQALADRQRSECQALGRHQRQRRQLRQVANALPHVAPILDRMLDGPARNRAWSAPNTPQRLEHVGKLLDAHQNREQPKSNRSSRSLEREARRVIIELASARHIKDRTPSWEACVNATKDFGPRSRRVLARQLTRVGGMDGAIAAATLRSAPPPTSTYSSIPGGGSYAFPTELLLQRVQTATSSDQAAARAQHPATCPQRQEDRHAVERAEAAERTAATAQHNRETEAREREQHYSLMEIVNLAVTNAATATVRAVTAPIRGIARLMTDPASVLERSDEELYYRSRTRATPRWIALRRPNDSPTTTPRTVAPVVARTDAPPKPAAPAARAPAPANTQAAAPKRPPRTPPRDPAAAPPLASNVGGAANQDRTRVVPGHEGGNPDTARNNDR